MTDEETLNLDPNGVWSLSSLHAASGLDARFEEEEVAEEDDDDEDDDMDNDGRISRDLNNFETISDMTESHVMTSSL